MEDRKKYTMEKQEQSIMVTENDDKTVNIKQKVRYKDIESGEIRDFYIVFPNASVTIEELKNNFEYVEKLDGEFIFNVALDVSFFNCVSENINEGESIFTIMIPDEE